MKNKRILIASWTFYPAWSYGGIARAMFELARQYTKDGYEVDCITTDVFDNDKRYNKTEDIVEGMHIYYFKNLSNVIANKGKFPIPIGLKKRLQHNIANYDIVHIADFRNIVNYHVYHQCIKHNIPYIVSPFGCTTYKIDAKMIIKKIFDVLWAKKMMQQAKYVTAENENECKALSVLGVAKEKIKTIPLMIDYEKFAQHLVLGQARKKLHIDDTAKILLFVGRIHKYKAPNMMIDCFYDYQKQIPNSYLIIVGRDDGYENHLKQYVKQLGIHDKVLFVGAIYYPEIKEYYRDADIYFAAPNHREGTPTVCLEALSCGTPVVVTKQALIPFIQDYNAGYVVTYDRKEIVQALIKMKHKDSNSCKELIKNHFDVRLIKNEFLKLYFN